MSPVPTDRDARRRAALAADRLSVRPRRPRAALALALLVAALAALAVVPPWSYPLLALRVGASEGGAYVAALAVVAALLTAPLTRGAPVRRLVAWALLGTALVRALQPFVGAAHAARAGRVAVDALPGRSTTPPAPATDTPLGTARDVGLAVAGALRGPPAAAGTTERRVAYAAADGSPLALRLYQGTAPGARPAVVVLYGGAWRSGGTGASVPADRALAALGYRVVALDYRHAPAHRWPTQLDDVRRGLALVRDSAAAWGIDPARIALLGRSSGAHLAMLAAWAPGDAPGAPPPRAVVSLYGPVDLVQGYADVPHPDPIDVRAVLRDFVGGPPSALPDEYRRASPVAWVRAGLPPTLLIYGTADHVVKARFGREAARALTAAGSPAALVELPWAEHGFDAVPTGPGAQVAHELVTRFLARVM